jgi:hypothetical protein
MDPLRNKWWLNHWRSLYIERLFGLLVLIPYFLFFDTFSFSTEKSKSLSKYRVSDIDENYLCRYSQSLHRIRGKLLESLKEFGDQRGCVSLENR